MSGSLKLLTSLILLLYAFTFMILFMRAELQTTRKEDTSSKIQSVQDKQGSDKKSIQQGDSKENTQQDKDAQKGDEIGNYVTIDGDNNTVNINITKEK